MNNIFLLQNSDGATCHATKKLPFQKSNDAYYIVEFSIEHHRFYVRKNRFWDVTKLIPEQIKTIFDIDVDDEGKFKNQEDETFFLLKYSSNA